MSAVVHQPVYERNTVTGRWRVRCLACPFWERHGTADEVSGLFATHDIEQWVSAAPPGTDGKGAAA